LQSVNLDGAILTDADLRDANCDTTKFYPYQMPKDAGNPCGAKITETTDMDMPPAAKFRRW